MVFVGPNKPIPTDPVLVSRVGVDQKTLREGLHLLTTAPQYQRVFGECKISEENLKKYPENGVPEALLRSLIYTADAASAKRDRAGYTLQEQSDDDSDADSPPADSKTQTEQPRKRKTTVFVKIGGAVDVNATAVTTKQLQQAIRQRQGGVALVLPAGATPASDYSSLFWSGAFYDLYPYGVGTLADEREIYIPPHSYGMHVMNRADTRFALHSVFAFALFNVIQRHRVRSSAGQSMAMDLLKDIPYHLTNLSPAAMDQAFADLEEAERNGSFASLRSVKDDTARKALQRVLREVRTVGGRLPLSNTSRLTARKEIYGMFLKFGPADMWMTINPFDTQSPLACHYAGATISNQLGGVIQVFTNATLGRINGQGCLLNNSGSIFLSNAPSLFQTDWNYIQTSSGVLGLALAGTNSGTTYSRFAGTSVTLDGTLAVTLGGGFIPQPPNVFDVLTFATRTGQFAATKFPSLPVSSHWQFTYNPGALELQVLPSNVFQSSSITNGNFQFAFVGQTGSSCLIEVSTNLLNWVPLLTNAPFTGSLNFVDPHTPQFRNRFYRATIFP